MEAPEGAEAQGEAEVSIQAYDSTPIPERIKQIWGYTNPYETLCLHTGKMTPLTKFKQYSKRSSNTLELLSDKTSVRNCEWRH